VDLVVVFVLGSDRPGIVARITSVLARHNANIVDISQTVLRGVFAMIMLVDVSGSDVGLGELRKELVEAGREVGVDVVVQHYDVYRAMRTV